MTRLGERMTKIEVGTISGDGLRIVQQDKILEEMNTDQEEYDIRWKHENSLCWDKQKK